MWEANCADAGSSAGSLTPPSIGGDEEARGDGVDDVLPRQLFEALVASGPAEQQEDVMDDLRPCENDIAIDLNAPDLQRGRGRPRRALGFNVQPSDAAEAARSQAI